MMEELGTIQDLLTVHDFYIIDSKGGGSRPGAWDLHEIGLDKDVTELSGGQRTKVLLGKLLAGKAGYPCFWTSPPTIWMCSISNG